MGQATTADPAPARGARPLPPALRWLAAAALSVRQRGVPPAAQGLIALVVYLAVWTGNRDVPAAGVTRARRSSRGRLRPELLRGALHWWPYALGHGLNPLQSAQIGAPAGD